MQQTTPARHNPFASLTQDFADYTFSPPDLLDPLRKDLPARQISHQYFGANHYSDLCSVVTIPHQTSAYIAICKLVITKERNIIEKLVNIRGKLAHDQINEFDAQLSLRPLSRNLLARAQVIAKENRVIGAGIYLGSHKNDQLGRELFEACRLGAPDLKCHDLRTACDHWGILQGAARFLIAAATWEALMDDQKCQHPKCFEENLAILLEHDLRNLLTQRQEEENRLEQAPHAFSHWLAETKLLHEQRQESSGRLLLPDSSSPDYPDFIFRRNKEPKVIAISPRKALRSWSKYLTISSLESVRIKIPVGEYSNYSGSSPPSYLEEDMKTLGRSPIAPRIDVFLVDVCDASEETIKLIFEHWSHFLQSLKGQNPWRHTANKQSVKLKFMNVVPEKAQMIFDLPDRLLTFEGIGILRSQVIGTGKSIITAFIQPS